MFKDYLNTIKPLFTEKDAFLFLSLPILILLGVLILTTLSAINIVMDKF